MYNREKRDEMLKNGFWPLEKENQECLATARGNLHYRPDLWEQYGLTDDYTVEGKAPYDILVFKPGKPE